MSRYGCILYPMNKKFISGIRIERRKEKRVPSPRPLGPYVIEICVRGGSRAWRPKALVETASSRFKFTR